MMAVERMREPVFMGDIDDNAVRFADGFPQKTGIGRVVFHKQNTDVLTHITGAKKTLHR
jgi:hypothetical protein